MQAQPRTTRGAGAQIKAPPPKIPHSQEHKELPGTKPLALCLSAPSSRRFGPRFAFPTQNQAPYFTEAAAGSSELGGN